MATHIKLEITDGATAERLRAAAAMCGMSLRGFCQHAATQHAQRIISGQAGASGHGYAFTPAHPYVPLVVPTGAGDAAVQCMCCGRVLPAQRCIVQHLLSHVVRGEVEAQIHRRGDGGRYVVYVDADGRQF